MDPNVDHQESEAQINVIYIACAGTSVVCCSLVLLCNLCERALSRFPSSLTMWRIVCDLLLSLQFLFVNVLQFMHRHDPPSERSVCSEPLAFLLQFGLFGSLSWYACLSANLYLSVTRPFTRPAQRTPLYHWAVWLGSAATGAIAASFHGYRPLYHLCWTRPELHSTVHAYNWALLFGWVLLFSVLSTLVLLYCQAILVFPGSARKRSQLQHRLRPRLAQLRASKLYTLAFSLYWAGLGALYAYIFVRVEVQGRPRSDPPRFAFAALLGLMGCWDAAVWVGVQAAVQPGALRAAIVSLPSHVLPRLSEYLPAPVRQLAASVPSAPFADGASCAPPVVARAQGAPTQS